jgi:hypothetical protein
LPTGDKLIFEPFWGFFVTTGSVYTKTGRLSRKICYILLQLR